MILVTGSDGQLGTQLKKIYSGSQALFLPMEELDVTDKNQIHLIFKKQSFTAVINCAAHTAVDQAEKEYEKALAVNASAIELLAIASAQQKIPMIHISTDYVFDGKSSEPYQENHSTNPLSVYGKTKLEGEKAFLKYAYSGALIRTSWVYDEQGKNFVNTIARLTQEKSELGIVSDQIGCPTYAFDLALAIQVILGKDLKNKEIYHFTNDGVASWYDFAFEINRLLNRKCVIKPIMTADYPTIATRPMYSVLDKQKTRKTFNIKFRHWKEALEECIKKRS